MALLGGIVTAMAIIYKVAASTPLPDYVRDHDEIDTTPRRRGLRSRG